MGALNVLATELVREVMGYLQGEELPLVLTHTRLLKIARSIHEDRTLSAQRKCAYLSSGALTTFVLNHSMVEVDMKLMNLTAKYGCLESVKILRARSRPCPWDKDTCMYAAKGGHLDVLQWLRSRDPPCPWGEDTCCVAALGGHLDVLQWARSQDPPCPWDGRTCSHAANGGHLDVLQWLRSQDPLCPWGEMTCSNAARGGHLDVLQWACLLYTSPSPRDS